MSSLKYNILFFISAIYIAIMLYLNNLSMAYGYIGILLIYSIINFDLGLGAYLILIPLTGAIDIPVFLQIAYTAIVCFVFFIKVVNPTERLYKTNIGIYFLLLVLLSFLAMLITEYFNYFHVLALLILTFIVAYIIVQRIKKNKWNVYLIVNAFILAAVIATVISYVLSGGEFNRLRLGDNVRQLSNTIGMALIFMMVFYFVPNNRILNTPLIKSQFKIIYRLRAVVILLLVMGLFATMSRGIIFSLGVALFFLVANYLYKNIKEIKLGPVLKIIFGALFISVIAFKYGLTFLSNFDIRIDLLADRFTGDAVEGGTGVREKIWQAGYSGLEGGQLIYGHGISSFQMLAARNGYDYYAHSVFMDTLITTGFLGLGVLLFLLLNIGRNIIENKDYEYFALYIYLVMAYFTHGAMASSGFWMLLAIIYGLSFSKKVMVRKTNMEFND